MTTTPNPHAIDLTKGTDVPESARLLFNDPHVPSFHATCGRSHVKLAMCYVVEHTNLICVVKDRCTTHLSLSVSHLVAEQRMLNLYIFCLDC